MSATKVVVGVFTYIDDLIKAIKDVKDAGRKFKVYTPTYIAELDHFIDHKRSNVRFFTAIGGCCGLIFGYSLAILCGIDWPLRVSAKDIIAPPGYFVVGYECTILFGALCTLLGLLHFCKLPNIFRNPGYDPRFSLDKFGLVVDCTQSEATELKSLLSKHGADEVSEQEGL